MAKIYLIRHCESEGNACRRTQAHVDALVTTKGYEQNEMLRRRFKNVHIDGIYSSDSYRSIMTVEPIAKERRLPIKVRILLRELTTGIWEDMAWGNIAREYPVDHENWSKRPWNMTAPGVSTFQQISDRLIFGLRRIAAEVGEGGTALAVSHSCSIKAALCTILGKPMTEVLDFGHGDNTSVSLLNIDAEGKITVEFMNDASHLPARLQRAWRGMANGSVNMEVYPCRWPEQKSVLLSMAAADAAERGEDFDAAAYEADTERLLGEHPNYIAISSMDGEVTGFTRIGTDEDLPRSCGLLERIYIVPALRGRDFASQLFGYCTHEMRYEDKTELAMKKDCTPEEQSVIDRFVFQRMKGLPQYMELELFSPTITCHVQA